MTDTNQLREAFEVRMTDGGKWPAAVERGRGGAYRLAQTENAWTEWQACAESLQAIAQVQGEAATVAVDHFDNAPHTNLTSRIHPPVEIGTKLYTTPQPAQATQAEVTGEREAFESCTLMEGSLFKRRADDPDKYWDGNVQDDWELWQARAILALRPERVPMTGEQRQSAFLSAPTSSGGHRTAFMLGIQFAEAHHDITAQAKKETT